MTQLQSAKQNIITDEMKKVAKSENISAEKLKNNIANGNTVIIKSKLHDCELLGIGKDLKIKINANIGTSKQNSSIEAEIKKLKAAIKYGADAVMDLSTGEEIDKTRKKILDQSKVPIGTVPIYQVIKQQTNIANITEIDFLKAIQTHINDGVDFITVHAGLTKDCIPLLKPRILGVVSRGGSFLVKWMIKHNKENPLYTHFDKIINMAKEHDVTISLGDGLRPGCLADATDAAQLQELKNLGKLAKIAQSKGVQVIIEGPGHVPLNQIKKNIELEKKYCDNAPFYVLGPLVTDIGAGYDHITGAIGGALAAMHGADFLCYLTPKEHLGLPDLKDVIDGVIVTKIAAHAADIARGIKGARNIDDKMSVARSDLNWEKMYSISLNPEKARSMRRHNSNTCSMCGEFCSAKINKECKKYY
jgi:phosphomethylpyrimidine synthase